MNATSSTAGRDLILLAGLWLPNQVWTDVVDELATLGVRAVVPDLPGADDGDTAATLVDQLATVLNAVDAATEPIVVGHSAAATLAWLAADRRPDRVHRVVLIGGFPESDGNTYAEFFPVQDGVMPFPGWEPFDGPDAEDLDDTARKALATLTVPVPEGVVRGTIELTDKRRYGVPVTLICPEFLATEAQEWVTDGGAAELGEVADLTYLDIDSGHWPMITRPTELAQLLNSVARD